MRHAFITFSLASVAISAGLLSVSSSPLKYPAMPTGNKNNNKCNCFCQVWMG